MLLPEQGEAALYCKTFYGIGFLWDFIHRQGCSDKPHTTQGRGRSTTDGPCPSPGSARQPMAPETISCMLDSCQHLPELFEQ